MGISIFPPPIKYDFEKQKIDENNMKAIDDWLDGKINDDGLKNRIVLPKGE